ncbi:GNAT family N-acetyltransferase [Patulibacter defluvii]|uniref:GNAT family N-acetyltransferase n=1 Tax=Patulibacter defluvii TaxID=3095358 RepID=UPI002A76142C|nr:GNAT family protein [Patulibacter sp. DM4]
MTIIGGERVTLRPVAPADGERLRAIVREPSVARWWSPEDEWAWTDEDGTRAWAIVVAGELVGLIQAYAEEDPEFRHAGLDLFVATAAQGRGIGPEAIHLLARHLIDEEGHHRLVIDPAAANERAIRAYERLGFRRVGVLRRYWRDPASGAWADGLLLDLLAEELRAPRSAES